MRQITDWDDPASPVETTKGVMTYRAWLEWYMETYARGKPFKIVEQIVDRKIVAIALFREDLEE